MKSSGRILRKKTRRIVYLFWFLGSIVLMLQGCAALPPRGNPGTKTDGRLTNLEEEWGIRPESIGLSAAGHMIDFRYRVIDPERAVKVMSGGEKTYLLDQASGIKLGVPSSPKVGSLRQTTLNPEANRVYFCIFTNPNNLVKNGSTVTVVMGDMKAEDLVVQ